MSGEDWAKPHGDNIAQVEFWNGRAGETWARNQERLDRAFAPLMSVLVEKAAPEIGERIIDVGCGCGDLALALAPRLGRRGHILGVDVSKQMLERAQARALAVSGEHATLAWLEADASACEFAAEYDLLVSRFGVMFFADPVAAFRVLRRALKPGGRFAFLCWRSLERNPWLAVPATALHDLLGPRPPADPWAPGPYALSDATRVCEMLREAGFSRLARRHWWKPLCFSVAPKRGRK